MQQKRQWIEKSLHHKCLLATSYRSLHTSVGSKVQFIVHETLVVSIFCLCCISERIGDIRSSAAIVALRTFRSGELFVELHSSANRGRRCDIVRVALPEKNRMAMMTRTTPVYRSYFCESALCRSYTILHKCNADLTAYDRYSKTDMYEMRDPG